MEKLFPKLEALDESAVEWPVRTVQDGREHLIRGLRKMREDKEGGPVSYTHLNQYQKALELFEEYVTAFGSNEDAEHEIAFLKTR